MNALVCAACGNTTFTIEARLDTTGALLATLSDPVCARCSSTAAIPQPPAPIHARDSSRQRARELAAAPPGTWMEWRTYPPEQGYRARVAASELRTGKARTVADLVGPVDARTVRVPGGGIRVEVARLA